MKEELAGHRIACASTETGASGSYTETSGSKAIGLDVSLSFARWLTGRENLHYGYWEDLEICAARVGEAQVAFTNKLFSMLPPPPLRILDIGGGAGEPAKELLKRGYDVEIIIPSDFLAERCRINAPDATVHQTTFENATLQGPFDVCLFAESFQYIALNTGLSKACSLLREGGLILLADCFRRDTYQADKVRDTVGGGHRIGAFREELARLDLDVLIEQDVTQAVAPSVEIEQGLYNVIGHAVNRIDRDLVRRRPGFRWILKQCVRAMVSGRRRARLRQRLMERSRNREAFAAANIYLMLALQFTGNVPGSESHSL